MPEEKPEQLTEQSHRVSTTGDIAISTYLEIAKGSRAKPTTEPLPQAKQETIVVIDFGSQYSMLIARRIRECQVYCEIVSHDTPWEKIAALNPKGFILSGGPASVYEKDSPQAPAYIYESHLPILGICYGMQMLAHQLGGKVIPGKDKEYGHAVFHLSDRDSRLFTGISLESAVWMSHGDRISQMPPGFKSLAFTENSPIAVMGKDDRYFGLQFHPEVAHTPEGKTILKNFVFNVCGCTGNWTMGNFINDSITRIRAQVGKGRVINALSGGVDSSVVATLLHQAIGEQL